MKKTSFLIWLIVWLFTQVVSLVSVTFLFALGLILIEFLLYPLVLGIGGLLVGLTAVWLSNLLVKDDLETPVNAVVGRCEVTAVALSLILIPAAFVNMLPSPPIFVRTAAATILAVAASYFAYQQRRPPIDDPDCTPRIIIWLFVAIASIPVVIYLASLVGWAGA